MVTKNAAWIACLRGVAVCAEGLDRVRGGRGADRVQGAWRRGGVEHIGSAQIDAELGLGLTAEGKALSKRIVVAEDALHDAIDQLVAGQPVDETITTLRAVANAFSAGQALARLRAAQEG